MNTPHVVLLGDSTLDNALYTSGAPDVTGHLNTILAAPWRATRCAIDGATTKTLDRQLMALPRDATHLILSIGGNDALGQTSIFESGASSAAEVLWRLADIAEGFEKNYREAVEACLRPGLPLAVCTIYNGCFPDPSYQRLASVALMVFNDVILRTAISHGLQVIDLRSVCSRPEDYANPIEPSSIGGEKIARAIIALTTDATATGRAARIVAR